ncbi:MAG: ACT domain-containing protein [Clostridia bacterium]|nr:ACT domain-containing protein [Clostridia bacterium]
MLLKRINKEFTVCKVASADDLKLDNDFYFIGKTKEEISLVCLTENTPSDAVAREDGWRAFCIDGELDFSLVGILSKISGILADNQIGIFAISTFNTDYILVKNENFNKAITILENEGYTLARE